MRNLYLVRHGKVDFPDGKRRCIGRTDTPLDKEGRNQARELAWYFKEHPVKRVYASPLTRARETAGILAGDRCPVIIKENLMELYMGEWENTPLKELKKGLSSEPITGERRRDGRRRFTECVEEILSESSEDVAIVAHAGINCCYLSGLLGSPLEVSRALPQPYGGFSRIEIENGDSRMVAELGRMPKDTPAREECIRIWNHYGTPEKVRGHCQAVCQEALRLGKTLEESGYPVDMKLIESAALLHDVMRHRPDHPMEGAKCLLREGYPKVASVIARHHDWGRNLEENLGKSLESELKNGGKGEGRGQGVLVIDWNLKAGLDSRCCEAETAVVYLADKWIQGTKKVTLKERFEASKEKCMECTDKERAMKVHELRYRQAKEVERLVLGWLRN